MDLLDDIKAHQRMEKDKGEVVSGKVEYVGLLRGGVNQ
jgi:hypothetical protein